MLNENLLQVSASIGATIYPQDAADADQLLRHADQAVRAAQLSRLTGAVSVGLASTTVAVLGLPLMRAMHERYPDVRLHMVEGMSGHLSALLNARELDLAVLFDARLQANPDTSASRLWQVQPLLSEDLFLISRQADRERPAAMTLAELGDEPLILPTGPHGLRSTLDTAFAGAGIAPRVVLEVDSLAMVMAAVDAGLGSTLQPWAALGRYPDAAQRFQCARLTDAPARRVNLLCTLSDDELSPAALAARVVLIDCVRTLVGEGRWFGATALAAGPDTHHTS